MARRPEDHLEVATSNIDELYRLTRVAMKRVKPDAPFGGNGIHIHLTQDYSFPKPTILEKIGQTHFESRLKYQNPDNPDAGIVHIMRLYGRLRLADSFMKKNNNGYFSPELAGRATAILDEMELRPRVVKRAAYAADNPDHHRVFIYTQNGKHFVETDFGYPNIDQAAIYVLEDLDQIRDRREQETRGDKERQERRAKEDRETRKINNLLRSLERKPLPSPRQRRQDNRTYAALEDVLINPGIKVELVTKARVESGEKSPLEFPKREREFVAAVAAFGEVYRSVISMLYLLGGQASPTGTITFEPPTPNITWY